MRYFLVLISFSLPAAAQAPAPAPQKPAAAVEKPAAAPPAEPRRPLILRLDEVDGPKMNFAPSADEKMPSQDLPSLGGDARTLERANSTRSSPYPQSSDNLQ